MNHAVALPVMKRRLPGRENSLAPAFAGILFLLMNPWLRGQEPTCPPGTHELSRDPVNLVLKCAPNDVPTPSPAPRPLDARKLALQNARAIRDAVSKGGKPPFKTLWDYYGYNRSVAQGLAPDENRCAIVLSMTLGLEPRPGEVNLQQLGDKRVVAAIVGDIKNRLFSQPVTAPEVANAEIAKRYYIRAQELANRLNTEWGSPTELQGPDAKKFITGKNGIVFLQHAYQRAGSLGARTGDHIDVWSSDHVASSSSTPFDKAEKVLFWEIR